MIFGIYVQCMVGMSIRFCIYFKFLKDDVDNDDEDEDEDERDEDYVDDVDGDDKDDCICGGCTKDVPDIPPKCCNKNPCLSGLAEGTCS